MSRTVALDVLDRIRIASPCSARWEDMTGDDRTRLCEQCGLNVYNLSDMSREDAAGLIQRTEGRLCVRLYRRPDGTVITRDCPTGLRAVRRRVGLMLTRVAAACGLAAGLIITTNASGGNGGRASLRRIQPFAALCDWLAPASVPPQTAVFIMGSVALSRAPNASGSCIPTESSVAAGRTGSTPDAAELESWRR